MGSFFDNLLHAIKHSGNTLLDAHKGEAKAWIDSLVSQINAQVDSGAGVDKVKEFLLHQAETIKGLPTFMVPLLTIALAGFNLGNLTDPAKLKANVAAEAERAKKRIDGARL